MAAPVPKLTRSPSERLAAWLATGPLGHLWSAVADITALWARYLLLRVRGRGPRKGGR